MEILNKETFELLKNLEKGYSLNENELSILRELNFVDEENKINEKGLNALEPYRVKRAVIMAAGFGSRMVPLTLTTPKPLVKVKGVRFIDTLIKRLVKVGITDITIVRGYLKDKFDILLNDYPFLKFVDNDKFDKENNISSAILVTDLFENAYICEADFYITGNDVIEKYQYETNYLCSLVDTTDDWCFDYDKKREKLVNYRKGGSNTLQAFGISYWNKKDGITLRNKLKEMYSDIENRDKFWEMCIFDINQDIFKIKPRLVYSSEIVEIDSYDELKQIDPTYK
ncbi:MAG: NTP transferase domain-containing protein [Bacilli bacterium]|nr:NTP transferase domain-containing protein [Bacilli bacterium]